MYGDNCKTIIKIKICTKKIRIVPSINLIIMHLQKYVTDKLKLYISLF